MTQTTPGLDHLVGNSSTDEVRDLVPAIQSSLRAKIERLLARPLIAQVADSDTEANNDASDVCDVMASIVSGFSTMRAPPRALAAWREDPDDGTFAVRIRLDYGDLWRGREKEIRELVSNTIENHVAFLTDAQKVLLERSPREFLALDPQPESAELLAFETENVVGSERVVELKVASAPELRRHVRHVAIVPNLVPLQRQVHALQIIEGATDDGPLAPLRALVGRCDPSVLSRSRSSEEEAPVTLYPGERLDDSQRDCVFKAMSTPHFAVIQGPPGSGKTTVIAGIIRRAIARRERVLVVSPTHVAVDNVVEKLAPPLDAGAAPLDPQSLPVRFAARKKRLSPRALEYWVGAKRERRGATIARRIERCLSDHVPIARALYAIEDKDASGLSPLSMAFAAVDDVICGTPIGVLSYESVKSAEPAAFDLLIVDEVSKLTLAEFLAVAVKARRWVLVGDPAQLPPFNDIEENGATLDEVLDERIEIACSVGALLERAHPAERRDQRIVVAVSDPTLGASAIRAHLGAVLGADVPVVVGPGDDPANTGILVCHPSDVARACATLSTPRGASHAASRDTSAFVRVLLERGVEVPRPAFASGARLVEARCRAPAQLFESAFNVYHAQPWSRRGGQKLRIVGFRNGIEKSLPSASALSALNVGDAAQCDALRQTLIEHVAERIAVNTISVYDWLTGLPTEHFDVAPLRELSALSRRGLCETVRPFVGTLTKQYRMHSSLSEVPRRLFYFDEALHDAAPSPSERRVQLAQVTPEGERGEESNPSEARAICAMLERMNSHPRASERRAGVMVITPYRKHEALLREHLELLAARGGTSNLEVEVCTLDRCQGREAEFVFISLVRSRATPFMDMPKRWNVALTRARQGLFIVGDIDAYRTEASRSRGDLRARSRSRGGLAHTEYPHPLMSLVARIIEAYDAHGEALRRAS